MKLLPRAQQPVGGFKHPKHLVATGPMHRAWNISRGWYDSNEYCIAPSSELYDSKLVRLK